MWQAENMGLTRSGRSSVLLRRNAGARCSTSAFKVWCGGGGGGGGGGAPPPPPPPPPAPHRRGEHEVAAGLVVAVSRCGAVSGRGLR